MRRLAPPGPEVKPILQGNGHVTPSGDRSELRVKLLRKHVIADVSRPNGDLFYLVVHQNGKHYHGRSAITFQDSARGSMQPVGRFLDFGSALPCKKEFVL